MSKIFVDTNVFVYANDLNEMTKREQSRKILSEVIEQHRGVVSTQVIQEFYVTGVSKLKIDPFLMKDMVRSFEHLEIVVIDFDIIQEAVDTSILQRVSFWDALIVVAAAGAQCEYLYTEDLNPGQIIRGVKVVNPFTDSR